MQERDRSPRVGVRHMGLVGLLFGALIVGLLIKGNDGDPAVMLAIGSDSPQLEQASELLGRDASSRGGIGHDGRFFFFQALDPLYLGTTDNADQLDLQLYRGQRMFFPLLAGAGGLAPPASIPWLVAVVQALAYGVGTAATARLAQQLGGSPWWGLAFALNYGLFMSVLVGGAGVVGLACAMAATVLLTDGRVRAAAVVFALAVLTREVMLLYVAGVVLFQWQRTRRLPLQLALIPGLSFLAWFSYVSIRLDGTSLYESNNGVGLPFVGLVRAAPAWRGDLFDLSTVALTALAGLMVAVSLVRRPSLLVAGAGGFVVLGVLMSELVWRQASDLSRGLTPLYTAFIVSTFAPRNQDGGSVSAVSGPQCPASLNERTVQPSLETTR